MFETPPPTEENIPDEPLAFFDVWTLALTSPTVETYQKLLSLPDANPLKGAIWVGVCSLISISLTLAIQHLLGNGVFQILEQAMAQNGVATPIPVTQFGITYLACVIPMAAISSIVGLLISAFLLKLISGMLGGVATTGSIFYLFAAFTAPISIFTGISAGIPYLNLLVAIPLGLYSIFLQVLAINAANRFGWGKAVGTVLILMAIGFGIACLLSVCMVSLMGAAFGSAGY